VDVGKAFVSIDPDDGYRQAIRTALPHARVVCDHFSGPHQVAVVP
jgi:hypothetical protein